MYTIEVTKGINRIGKVYSSLLPAFLTFLQLGNKFFGHLIVDCDFSIRLNQETVNMIKIYLLCASSLSSHLECAACW